MFPHLKPSEYKRAQLLFAALLAHTETMPTHRPGSLPGPSQLTATRVCGRRIALVGASRTCKRRLCTRILGRDIRRFRWAIVTHGSLERPDIQFSFGESLRTMTLRRSHRSVTTSRDSPNSLFATITIVFPSRNLLQPEAPYESRLKLTAR